MWEAARSALPPETIKAIVAKQSEKAAGGDERAARFLFDVVMGGSAFKGATFVQKNETHNHSHYHEDQAADDPTSPATWEKNRQRKAARLAATVD